MSASPTLRQRLSRVPPGLCVDLVVAAYAVWTVTCNAVVIAGGTVHVLVYAAPLALALLATGVAIVARSPKLAASYLADLQDEISPAPASPLPSSARYARALAIGAGVTALGVWLGLAHAWASFAALALSVLAALYYALRVEAAPAERASPQPLVDSKAQRTALYGLAILCALFALVSLRPRSDDTLYLSMAVSVMDFPDLPLLSAKTLHGPAGHGIGPQEVFPPYRVHSFELIGGVLGHLTGIEAAAFIHFGLATLFAFMTPFAAARLLRLLAPRHWLLALCVLVSYYVIEGSASRGFANHALVRLFNGKSVLLTVAVPLLAAYGLRFGARPTLFRFAMLALANITALGLSSTGIWLAPVVTVASAAAGAPNLRASVTRGLAAVGSAGYVLAIGVWVASQLNAGISEPSDIDAATDLATAIPRAELPRQFALLQVELPIILGPTRTALATLAVAFLAAPFAATVLGARFFAIAAALTVLVFANPLLSKLVAAYATGTTAYHRVLWLLPAPIALAALAARVRDAAEHRVPKPAALLAALGSVALFYAVAVDRLVISEANGAKLVVPPQLKLPPHARMIAQEVCKVAPEGSRVLAPIAVMQQMPILSHCGHPLIAHDRWLTASTDERANRNALAQTVSSADDISLERAGWFLESLDKYAIDVVVLSRESARAQRTKSLVRLAGLERIGMVDWNQVYARPGPKSRGSSLTVARRICERVPKDAAVLAPFSVAAALERRKCAAPLGTVQRFLAASHDAADEMLALERMAQLAGDLPQGKEPWLVDAVARHGIGAVVIAEPAMANRHFRAVLADLGFEKVSKVQNHSIYVRKAGSAP